MSREERLRFRAFLVPAGLIVLGLAVYLASSSGRLPLSMGLAGLFVTLVGILIAYLLAVMVIIRRLLGKR